MKEKRKKKGRGWRRDIARGEKTEKRGRERKGWEKLEKRHREREEESCEDNNKDEEGKEERGRNGEDREGCNVIFPYSLAPATASPGRRRRLIVVAGRRPLVHGSEALLQRAAAWLGWLKGISLKRGPRLIKGARLGGNVRARRR